MKYEFDEKQFEKLIIRREDLKKKQLMAFSMNVGNHIHQQFQQMLDEVEMEIYSMNEIKKENAKKETDDDGLII